MENAGERSRKSIEATITRLHGKIFYTIYVRRVAAGRSYVSPAMKNTALYVRCKVGAAATFKLHTYNHIAGACDILPVVRG